MVQLDVMAAAQAADGQWLVVTVMMGVNGFGAADLAGLLVQAARRQCPLHGQMGAVFPQIGPTPLRLARLAGQSRRYGFWQDRV